VVGWKLDWEVEEVALEGTLFVELPVQFGAWDCWVSVRAEQLRSWLTVLSRTLFRSAFLHGFD